MDDMEPQLDTAMAGDSREGVRVATSAGYDYPRFSTLAGKLTDPPQDVPYRVSFRHLGQLRPVRTTLLVMLALLFVGGFLAWLMLPAHWPHNGRHTMLQIASIVMVVNTGVIGLFALVNVSTLCRASLLARDPTPVTPEPGTRVAFLTTIVPDREPLLMVRRTLEAARRIEHDGQLDVWLLDEGGSVEVQEACAQLGVHYFTRNGVERWNRPAGSFRARTKHGNYNSWLDAHGEEYDFMLSVDPDHVPLENYAERFLGYFRDPDVAFVVGPQVYGNYKGFVTRAAESQQFLFHSLLQRAGNHSRTPMLVGTNNAIRISALRQVGGFQDSITEDMATSLQIHAARNPDTNGRWGSVYTPDVVAVGEGPTSFGDYFSQQYRWSRGTDDVLLTRSLRLLPKLRPRQILHYALLMSYYPTTAVAWMLGVCNGILYLTLRAGGVTVPMHLWLMLYVDAAVLQGSLYFWNRRHNVSPHERRGSSGLSGMFISTLCTPIYVSSLMAAVLRRASGFVVTRKGGAVQADGIVTFRKHLGWAAVICAPFVASLWLGNVDPWMYLWSLLALLVCLLPLVIWSVGSRSLRPPRLRGRRRRALDSAGRLAEGMEPA
jgi:cellulose synthase/poly-beta-1,6-N-acetylglucosamine synthase-like glycosyltransferase